MERKKNTKFVLCRSCYHAGYLNNLKRPQRKIWFTWSSEHVPLLAPTKLNVQSSSHILFLSLSPNLSLIICDSRASLSVIDNALCFSKGQHGFGRESLVIKRRSIHARWEWQWTWSQPLFRILYGCHVLQNPELHSIRTSSKLLSYVAMNSK